MRRHSAAPTEHGSRRPMLSIAGTLFLETFRILRKCGQMGHECQALWLSAPSLSDTIVGVRHSVHASTCAGLEVSSDWLSQIWRELADTGLSIRAQIHTHPAEAFHSGTDDAYPIVGTPGFISIVVPRFAADRPALGDLYVTSISANGGWTQLTSKEVIRIT